MTVKGRVRELLRRPAWRVLYGRESEPVTIYDPPGTYSSPIPSRADIEKDAVLPVIGIDLRLDAQCDLLDALDPRPVPPGRYEPSNPYFGASDAAVYQALLRHLRPGRVLEIGSGFSTTVLLDTYEQDLPEVTLIEPYPDRLLSRLRPGDLERVTLHRAPLQDVPADVFAQLGAGDFLFVDSTHISKYGSDVNRLFFSILPQLAPGVYVHVHDIPWPFEYSPVWLEEGRAYNEAYLLRAFLEFNDHFEIVLWNSLLSEERGRAALPGESNTGGSIWLRRVEPTLAT